MEIGPLASRQILTVGPGHTLAETARRMVERKVGAAVVAVEGGMPGIITERDLLRAISSGADLAQTSVEEYMTSNAITASPSWDVAKAARCMIDGGFRHLLVLEDSGRVAGILSIRDLVPPLLDYSD